MLEYYSLVYSVCDPPVSMQNKLDLVKDPDGNVVRHQSLCNNDKPGATMLCQLSANFRYSTTVLSPYHLP